MEYRQWLEKKRLIPLLSLAAGLLGGMLIYQSNANREQLLRDSVSIVSLAKEIKAGETVTPDMLVVKEIPRTFCPAGAVTLRYLKGLSGRRATVTIPQGQVLLWNCLDIDPSETGLASRLKEGERAITLSVDRETGLEGMLRAGNRVDIVATYTLVEGGGRRVTRMLLQNITVMALNREQESGPYQTVTLRVSPAEAELLAFADDYAALRLVLRGTRDFQTIEELPTVDFGNLQAVQKSAKAVNGRKDNPRIVYD